MPSEQTAGRPVFASDLYSLGLTAIYLLTGKILMSAHNSFLSRLFTIWLQDKRGKIFFITLVRTDTN